MAEQQKTRLSRKDMEEVIKGGGSVLHDGRIITSVEDLPKPEELAETDAERAATAEDLRREIAERQDRLAALEVRNSGATAGGNSPNGETATGDQGTGGGEPDPRRAELEKHTKDELIAMLHEGVRDEAKGLRKADLIDRMLGGE